MPGFDAIEYQTDLLVASLLLCPLFYLLRWPGARRALLILSGLYLLAVIAPRLALFYLAFWALVWPAQNLLASSFRRGELLLWPVLLAALAPMLLWKLFPEPFTIRFNLAFHELLGLASAELESLDAVRRILVPIGLSFSTFRAVDLLIQTHLGTIGRLSPDRVLFYGLFPPVLVIGPIIEYREIEERAERAERLDPGDLAAGAGTVGIGLVKVFVLALPLQWTHDVFLYFDQNPIWLVWVGLLLFAWYWYLNFAGYSDIAIGSARLYGFRLKDNFDFPYFRESPQAFWASWHMSLTRFAQRNVFVPVGGYRPRTQYVALALTMMTIALWHDLSVSWVLFGLYHGAGLCANRYWVNRRRAAGRTPAAGRFGAAARSAGTFLYVALSLPMVSLPHGELDDFYLALVGL